MNQEEQPTSSMSEKDSLKYLAIGVGALILIILLIFFVFKYINPYKPEQVTYNYFNFIKKDTHWMTDWQSKQGIFELGFRFNPFEAESVQLTGQLNSSFNDRDVIYVTFDPLADSKQFKYVALGSGELLLILKRALNKNVEMACTQQDNDACVGRPIINCDPEKSVILLKPNAPTKLVLEDSCIIIQGEGFELLKSIDRILYQWLKIMK
ncbi:hypothetical protein HZA97_03290 [Candidatus Woesearchaeota archaeon]|nr:hypothetical protein [Candidatus Woesearchaeota archaeon]